MPLLVSPPMVICALGWISAVGEVLEGGGAAFPVMRSLLNESTSIEPFAL